MISDPPIGEPLVGVPAPSAPPRAARGPRMRDEAVGPRLHNDASSYDACGSATPLLGLTIDKALERVAAAFPGVEAVVSRPQGLRFTYREFDAIVTRAAKALLALGIEKGDRVAIWSTNNYEWVTAQYATARIGAILVNINPAYRTHELEYVLRQSRSKVLMLVESFKTSNYVDMLYEVCPEVRDAAPGRIDSWRFPDLRSVVFIGSKDYPGMFTRRTFVELGDEVADDVLEARRAMLDIDDDINIQYTSGTTGFPKGVTLSHNNILNNAYFIARNLRLTSEDRMCLPVPFYHCFGMVMGNLTAMTAAATVVIPSPAFDVVETLKTIQEERITCLHGVPTMFIAELQHPDFPLYDMSSLRTGIMAGAPCPTDVMTDVIDRMNMREILIAYGQTESSPVVTMTRPDDSFDLRVGSVGRCMPHQEIKVIDPATGATVPRGAPGELCFRGYQVMSRYDNNPEATAEAIDDQGWLHSGDIGVMGDGGYIKITGRIKEMVIRGGENIYPREIEEFIRGLPIVYDVAVVGVPDERFGEELLAWVKLKPGVPLPTTEEFRAMCQGRIAHFKIPRYWQVIDEFPMTVTGKIQKFKIREQAIRDLGLERAAAIKTA